MFKIKILEEISRCLEKYVVILLPELKAYYDLYQLLLFHLKEQNSEHFFGLIQYELLYLNYTLKTALTTFIRYKTYLTNAMELPYSNSKLEATNKLIKDIKRNAFGYWNFENFKKHIYITLNITKEKSKFASSHA